MEQKIRLRVDRRKETWGERRNSYCKQGTKSVPRKHEFVEKGSEETKAPWNYWRRIINGSYRWNAQKLGSNPLGPWNWSLALAQHGWQRQRWCL